MERFRNYPQELLIPPVTHRGFCGGVHRAIRMFERAHQTYPNDPIYGYHAIVHNEDVVHRLEREANAQFVEEIQKVPEGGIVVFSAHGVSPAIRQEALNRGLRVFDATCPSVQKTHEAVKRYTEQGRFILYIIEKSNHDEVIGTTGEAPRGSIGYIHNRDDISNLVVPDTSSLAVVTQTTLSYYDTQPLLEDIRTRFPNIIEPPRSEICPASQNRQRAAIELVNQGAKLVIVIGSQTSSNSKRLKEVVLNHGAKSFLVSHINQLDLDALCKDKKDKIVGLTISASAPDDRFQEAIQWFIDRSNPTIREISVPREIGLPALESVS